MIIPIDDKQRIRGTAQCWQLEELHTVNDEPQWRPQKYFVSIDDALHAAAQREIRVFPATGLIEAINACKRVTQKYAKIFDEVGKSPRDGK